MAHPGKSFDRIARAYRWLERLTLGNLLWRARVAHLPALETAHDVLILGEGDGRFLQELLGRHRTCRVDVIERSAKMVELARERASLQKGSARVRFFETDIAAFVPARNYDAIVCLFFLDCFAEPELGELTSRIGSSLRRNGLWLYADFVHSVAPRRNLRHVLNRLLIAVLYWAFNQLTDIRARQLCDPRRHFRDLNLRCKSKHEYAGGLLSSELWASEPGDLSAQGSPPLRTTIT